MEKTLSSNQASLIFCIFTIGLKLSALPALMYNYAGNDSYMVCLIALIFDFVGTIVIINIMHKYPNKTFYQMIKQTMGKIIAIILQVLLLLYFVAKCVLVLQELHDYFIATLFEELNPVFFLIVLGLLLLYATTKNFRTIGRLTELIFWPTFVGIIFTLIFPIEDIQIEKLLPLFTQGFYPIFQALSRTTFAFGDFMILLPLMGHITFNKNSKKRMIDYSVGAFLFIFSFYVIFAGSFGRFAINQTLALGELPLHNTTPATIGKLEWLTIIIWTVILLTDAMVLTMASKKTFDNLMGGIDRKWTGYVLTVILVVIVGVTYMQLESLIQLATTPIFASISGGIQAILATLISIAELIYKKKNPPNPNITIPKQKNKKVSRC